MRHLGPFSSSSLSYTLQVVCIMWITTCIHTIKHKLVSKKTKNKKEQNTHLRLKRQHVWCHSVVIAVKPLPPSLFSSCLYPTLVRPRSAKSINRGSGTGVADVWGFLGCWEGEPEGPCTSLIGLAPTRTRFACELSILKWEGDSSYRWCGGGCWCNRDDFPVLACRVLLV